MSSKNTLNQPSSLKNRILKKLTLLLFILLPARITRVFISLSIISLIFSVRNSRLASEATTVERVGKMLSLHLDDGVLLLPEQTCSWYWNEDFLGTELKTGHGAYTMRELIKDNHLFIQHRNLVLNALLDSLPKSLFNKLQLRDTTNKLEIKHNITSAFMYA